MISRGDELEHTSTPGRIYIACTTTQRPERRESGGTLGTAETKLSRDLKKKPWTRRVRSSGGAEERGVSPVAWAVAENPSSYTRNRGKKKDKAVTRTLGRKTIGTDKSTESDAAGGTRGTVVGEDKLIFRARDNKYRTGQETALKDGCPRK